MGDDDSHSTIEITIGGNNLQIEGSESFISQQISTILDRIDLGAQVQVKEDDSKSKQATLEDVSGEGTSPPTDTQSESKSSPNVDPKITEISDRINTSADALAEHFYLEGESVHVQNPMDIEPKYALLGYCTVKEEITEEPYHENTETKEKLIDIEKVDVTDWGGNLLHKLRQQGLIKDDPNSQKKRNLPFQVTPQGRKELIQWLNEDN